MKKFLFIFILLFSTNSFAQIILFDRCFSIKEAKNFDDFHNKHSTWDEWFFEINLSNGTVVRTNVASDAYINESKEKFNIVVPKRELETYTINSASTKIVQTNFKGDASMKTTYIFNLKTGELDIQHKIHGKLKEPNYSKCEIYGSGSSGSSGVKGFLKKLLGNN